MHFVSRSVFDNSPVDFFSHKIHFLSGKDSLRTNDERIFSAASRSTNAATALAGSNESHIVPSQFLYVRTFASVPLRGCEVFWTFRFSPCLVAFVQVGRVANF